jgi:hypothetical protein
METGCQEVCKWKKGWEPLQYDILSKRYLYIQKMRVEKKTVKLNDTS